MKASLPEISAVSWTDFMTGTNSGTHGIFGFTDFKPDSYELRFPNFLDVKAPTFWDTLGAKGKKSIIINQPSTYPARQDRRRPRLRASSPSTWPRPSSPPPTGRPWSRWATRSTSIP